ncbi:hypothetical protein [Flavitalea sp.]|nr:hypothetical protein [Flavitalea sp.]
MQLKHLLITVITFTSLSASAQISKGSVFLGGNLYFSTQKNENYNYKNTNLGISPSIGKAIKQNLVAGFDITYQNQQTRNNDSTKTSQQLIGGGVFIRKYAPIGKGFYLFGHARAGGSYNTTKQESNSSDESMGYTVNLNAYPGISFEVNRKLHLEASLPGLLYISHGMDKYTRTDGSEYKQSAFSVGTSISNATELSVGLRVLIAQ